MSNPGVEPTDNNTQGTQPDEAPGVAPTGGQTGETAAPKKASWLKRALIGAAAVGVVAAVISQCSNDDQPQQAPQTPAAPAAPQTLEPDAGNQRGSYIYRYIVTEDTELNAPRADDPATVLVGRQSCVESVLGRDSGLSRSGNKIEIMAMAADGVNQAHGFIDSNYLLNNGARDSADKRDVNCIATFIQVANVNANSTIENNVTAGEHFVSNNTVRLHISHTQTVAATSIGDGSCVTTTGRSGNGRTEFSMVANGREYTVWGDMAQFRRAPDYIKPDTCQAKLGR